jgi:predicted transcriptional regulator
MYEPGEDAPKVRRSKDRRLNPPSFAQMIKGLRAPYGLTVQELAEFCGLCEWTVRHYCKALVLAQEAHICRWGKDSMGRDVTPYYRLGWGINIPREVKTGAQKQRERRSRLRKQAVAINEKEHRI